MFGYDSMINMYKTFFSLVQHHKYSLTELENMMPWERFVYVDMLNKYIREEEERLRDLAATKRAESVKRR